MMFILRAIFWLSVVAALMPAREHEHEQASFPTAGQLAGAAVDYCRKNPETCSATAGLGAQALRIPADFILQTQKTLPAPSRHPASL